MGRLPRGDSCAGAGTEAAFGEEEKNIASVVRNLPESPGSIMYEEEGESFNDKESCLPCLYWTIILYTHGIIPSIYPCRFGTEKCLIFVSMFLQRRNHLYIYGTKNK